MDDIFRWGVCLGRDWWVSLLVPRTASRLRVLTTLVVDAVLDYPCGNFSDTSSFKFQRTKGSIGHAFTVCIHTENQNQASFSPFGPHDISVLIELALGHLRYLLTDVPPQPNSPPDYVFRADQPPEWATLKPTLCEAESQSNGKSKK